MVGMVALKQAFPGRFAVAQRNAGRKPENPEVLDELVGNGDALRTRGTAGRRSALAARARVTRLSLVRFPCAEGILVGIEPVAEYVAQSVVNAAQNRPPYGRTISPKTADGKSSHLQIPVLFVTLIV